MASKLELQVIARDQASKVLKGIRGDVKDLGSAAGNSRGALSQMFSVAGGDVLARGIASAASAMVGLGKAAVGAVADMVNASAGMNAQVSGIGAVLGLTQGELVKVKDLINQLGVDPNLKVNAQEAADAIDMLARNGLTLEQILGGAAEATVFLANATGGEFATSANVATDVMAMFKISAEDMMTAVNGITSVTVASKFGLDDYRLAIAQAGGVASALGVNFADFNASIAATSASFASGSDAGTSFKTFLQRLVPQSDEASAAMAELGLYTFSAEKAMTTLTSMGVKPLSGDMNTLITQLLGTYAAQNNVNVTTEEGIAKFNEWAASTGFVQNAFYDANGSMKSMADVSAVLNEATAGLTEQQKNQYLTTIFGSDAMRTAFGLAEKGAVVYTDVATASRELGVSQQELAQYMAGGITAFEALQATMSKTDALASAQMRVNNLAGDMDIFSGIVDSLKIQIGDNLQPALRTLFQSMTAALTALSPQILAFGNAIGVGITAATAAMLPYIQNADQTFLALVATFANVQASVTATIAAWQPFAQTISAVIAPVISVIAQFVSFQDVLMALGALAAGPVVAAMAGLVASMTPITLAVTGVVAAVSLLRNAWVNDWGGIQEKTATAWATIEPILTSIQSAFTGQLPTALSTVSTAFSAVTSTLDSLFGPALARLRTAFASVGTGLGELSPQFAELQSAITTAITTLQPVIQAFGLGMSAVFGVGASVLINSFTAIFQALPTTVGAIISQLSATITVIATTLASTVGIVTSLLRGDFAGAWTNAQTLVQGFATFGIASITNFTTLAGAAFTGFKTILTGTFSDITNVIGLDRINAQLETVRQTITEFFTGASGVLTTAFSVVLDTPAWLGQLTGWTWPEMPSWEWPDLPEWAWPGLPDFAWPALPTFTWPSLPTFTWPDIPMPDWISQLRGLIGVSYSPAPSSGNGTLIGKTATGTDNWRGGWTWVGEKGPELLNLPKGSQILSNTESNKMIGQLADGTTTATATGGAPRQQGNVFSAIANAAKNFGQAGTSIQKAASAMSKSVKDLEAGLRKVPGLFGTSQVTEQQMKMGELGIPQNFADDWIRRLTDEVVNGVDWEGVDIKDAAARAGINPALPAEAILEMVKEKWNDKSLFADSKNLDLINMDAVKAAMEQQAQAKLGETNFLNFLGITPQQTGAAGASAGAAVGTGMLTGITTSLTDGAAGAQVATAISTGVTAESMAPVGATVVSGLATEMKKEEYNAQIGGALSALFTGYLDKADAFTDVAQRIMTRISAQFGNVTGLDMVSKFTDAFRAQLGTDEAIASLAKVGEKILELVFRGYLDEARKRNWAEGVNAKGDTTSTATDTATTTAGNAIGTRSWRGGMTWVGETGPELVSLPARSRIFNPSESMALAGAGGGDVYITNHFAINNEIDYEAAAYRIADIFRRRR